MIPKLIYIILKFGFLAALGIGKLSSLKVENALGLRGVDCEDTIDGDTINGIQSRTANACVLTRMHVGRCVRPCDITCVSGLRGVDCEDTIDGDTIDGTQSTAHNQGPPMRVLSGVEDPIRSEWTSSLVCKISKLHCSGLRFV